MAMARSMSSTLCLSVILIVVYLCIYLYTYTHTCTHVCTNLSSYICIYKFTHTCTYAHNFLDGCAHAHAHAHAHIHVHTHVHTWRICTCTYIVYIIMYMYVQVCNAFFILVVCTTIYAILGTHYFSHRAPVYSSKFKASMFTMFQVMTGGKWVCLPRESISRARKRMCGVYVCMNVYKYII